MEHLNMSTKIAENSNKNLKRTPLFQVHNSFSAKMVNFSEWEMPVQYPTGLLAEHKAVRTSVGVFDVSHMGELLVQGKSATEFLQNMTLNDIQPLSEGQAQYSALCNEDGKVLDDIIIYKMSDEKYFICVNAGNIEKDFIWLKSHNQDDNLDIKNLSEEYALIAVQGPKSREILSKVLNQSIVSLDYYHFYEQPIFNENCIVSRTGYTGELGYEIYCPAQIATQVWNEIFHAGENDNIIPCGLAARDILRLEAGYLLYGNDMNESSTALECGLKWITKFNKPNFIGKIALLEQEKCGLKKRLVGFEMTDRAIGRQGYKVFNPNDTNQEIGVVTSGSPSPSLSKNIGFMFLDTSFAKLGTNILVDIRGSLKPAQVIKKSFYTLGSVRA